MTMYSVGALRRRASADALRIAVEADDVGPAARVPSTTTCPLTAATVAGSAAGEAVAAGGGVDEPEHAASRRSEDENGEPLHDLDYLIGRHGRRRRDLRRSRVECSLQRRRLAAGLANLAEDAIFHPVRIPPLDRIHRHAVDEHREVQVIAARQPGCAGPAEWSGPSRRCRPLSRPIVEMWA